MTELREQLVKRMPLPQFSTLLVEEYYEIVKELITAIMSTEGWKTVSHELLVGYLAKFYPQFRPEEIALIDQLRTIRNDIAYRGIMISSEYLQRNEPAINAAIEKLKQTLLAKRKDY